MRYLVLDRLYRENDKRLSQKDKDKGHGQITTIASIIITSISISIIIIILITTSTILAPSSSPPPLLPLQSHSACPWQQQAIKSTFLLLRFYQRSIRACFGMISRYQVTITYLLLVDVVQHHPLLPPVKQCLDLGLGPDRVITRLQPRLMCLSRDTRMLAVWFSGASKKAMSMRMVLAKAALRRIKQRDSCK